LPQALRQARPIGGVARYLCSLTHLPSRKSIGTMWRAAPGKTATPFGKSTRRSETGAGRAVSLFRQPYLSPNLPVRRAQCIMACPLPRHTSAQHIPPECRGKSTAHLPGTRLRSRSSPVLKTPGRRSYAG